VGFRVVVSDDFKPDFLWEQELVHVREDNTLVFYDTKRNMLDDVSSKKV